jgi:hypothetical protein
MSFGFKGLKWKYVSIQSAFVHACGKIEDKKYILSLSLELVKVGGYDFPTHVMVPGSYLFSKRTLVDTEFDIPGIH